VLFDRDDRYVLTNSNYRRLYPGVADLFVPGTCFETVIRANVERNLHNFGPDGPEAWAQRNLDWHRACDQAIETQLIDGHWVRAVERRTSDGGIVGIRTDITALKNSEAALQQRICDLEEARSQLEAQQQELSAMAADLAGARDVAEAASKTKSEFLANMSHDAMAKGDDRTSCGEHLGDHGRPTGEGDDSQQEHCKERPNATSGPPVAAHNVLSHAKSQPRSLMQRKKGTCQL
jgi:PAS fold